MVYDKAYFLPAAYTVCTMILLPTLGYSLYLLIFGINPRKSSDKWGKKIPEFSKPRVSPVRPSFHSQ